MPYIQREDGKIVGLYAKPQSGYADEFLKDDNEEVIGFLNQSTFNPVIILYPVDLWYRLSDEEADMVESAMATHPVRLQNIFRTSSSYRSDHELWPILESIASGLFGEARSKEILAASEIV